MTPDVWREVERLYHLALEQPAESRAAFVAQACGGDEVLRREVESLLSSSEDDEGYLETPALSMVANAQARHDACSNLAGTAVSHYRILERLGSGRRALFYRAEDTRLGRAVVLGFLTWIVEAEGRARFERAARAAAVVNHPNLCTIHDIGERNAVPFVVTEFLEGETLEQRLARKGFEICEAVEVGLQVADGLDAVHRAGMVHGELNAANLFLTKSGHVKILGLGVAQTGEAPDARGDLCGLGAVLDQITKGAALPAKLHDVIAKALEKDREVQYQHAADLRADLKRVKREWESLRTPRREPSRLGRYEITGELGTGGMGTVYRGVDPVIDRTVAIKTIPQDRLGSPAEAVQLTERLKREARAAGNLTHPNIVTVFDAGEEQGFTYIVMELIPGSTLDAVVSAAGTLLPAERVLEILEQAAGGLDFAHSQGVVNRDVKPSNIMVQSDGKVKLTDFGIARRITATSVTMPGAVAGSPYFMSPEQLRGQDAGPRSDQYSLAVVAWILLTGTKPFDDEGMAPLIAKILGQEPPRSSQLSQAADAVLRRALAKDASLRFESCTSFVAALRGAVVPQKHRSKRGLVVVVGLLAACLFAGVGVVKKLRMVAPAAIAPPQSASSTPTIEPPPKSDPPAPVGAPAPVVAKKEAKVAAALLTAKPGETKSNSTDGLTYVWVPPGSFSMGCSPEDNECIDDEKPAHPVTISKGFWMGQTEVTDQAYAKVTGKDVGVQRRARRPVRSATWEEARDYCKAVGMRLPTEAEWEYAARAGTTGSRYGDLDKIAWFEGNGDRQTHDVATKTPNAWGLYDMLGNVAEFTAGWFGRYDGGAATDPQGPASGRFRVRRGGGARLSEKMARASYRMKLGQGTSNTAGFRCVGN